MTKDTIEIIATIVLGIVGAGIGNALNNLLKRGIIMQCLLGAFFGGLLTWIHLCLSGW